MQTAEYEALESKVVDQLKRDTSFKKNREGLSGNLGQGLGA